MRAFLRQPFLLLLAILLWSAPVVYAHPHGGEELLVNLECKIHDDKLECAFKLSGSAIYELVYRKPFPLSGDPSIEDLDEKKIHAFLKEVVEVEIDNIAVQPIYIKKQLIANDMEPGVDGPSNQWTGAITVHYPLKSAPRTISITCLQPDLFERMERSRRRIQERISRNISGLEEDGMGAPEDSALQEPTISGFIHSGSRLKGIVLTRKDPGYIWHSLRPVSESNMEAATADFRDPRQTRKTIMFATVSIAAVIGCFIAMMVRRIKWLPRMVALVGLLVVAGTAGSMAIKQMRKKAIPPPREAIDTFKALHGNIYRAFDYVDESDIYDALAQSVSGPILDEIYQTVFRGLVLWDEGGAVCAIDKIDVLDAEFIAPTDPKSRYYQVRCEWNVVGVVSHWGHTHRRVNQYNALYTVSAIQGEWRITDSKVTKQKRVD